MPQRATKYQVDLAIALIERMQNFCNQAHIRLIVVDIPAFPADYQFAPSLPEFMIERLRASHIEVVSSKSLLGPFQNSAEMHVRHGYHHISEFTHTLIGADVARRIEAKAL